MFWKKKIANVDADRCDLCGICIKGCRRSALEMYTVHNRAAVRLRSADACAGCGLCARICPRKAIELKTGNVY
ncbi:MAG: 4Fe-4S binding protein [Tannerellaceae bacterium]|jgi:pyruvate ferredoxin oxidoreductase delta subunit/phenylglyoxylate dehydrogenase delta subunit|nr:4Fe-4S binding protein [Tannerellaceae bacterium]